MRDIIGNALIRLGKRIRRTKYATGGYIPAPPKSVGVPVALSPGYIIPAADVAKFAEGMRRAKKGGAL